MIKKDMSEITYEDIKSLQDNKVTESDELDYKSDMIKDQDMVKHVCAFANAHGGHIILGVRESGRGGYPENIDGIDNEPDKERLEQIIVSNIAPKPDITIRSIQNPNTKKYILIIHIPKSRKKPHQSGKTKKFYKRLQFESAEMDENDIADAYKGRFYEREQIEDYARKFLVSAKKGTITVNILVIPYGNESSLVDPSNKSQIEKIESISTGEHFGSSPLPNNILTPSSIGLTGQSTWMLRGELHIHRNGCVQYVYFDDTSYVENSLSFSYRYLAGRLLQILQLSSSMLSNYKHSGDVKIITTLETSSESAIYEPVMSSEGLNPLYTKAITEKNVDECERVDGNVFQFGHAEKLNAKIEMEHSIHYVEKNYIKIAALIMNEVFNHYGRTQCPLFDGVGNTSQSLQVR